MHIEPPALVCLFCQNTIIKKKKKDVFEIQGKTTGEFLKSKVE